jgi:hypothetical protein
MVKQRVMCQENLQMRHTGLFLFDLNQGLVFWLDICIVHLLLLLLLLCRTN